MGDGGWLLRPIHAVTQTPGSHIPGLFFFVWNASLGTDAETRISEVLVSEAMTITVISTDYCNSVYHLL